MYIHRWHYHYFNRLYFTKKIFLKCFYILFPRIRTLTKFVKSPLYIIDTQQQFGTKNINKSLHKSERARIYVHCIKFNHKQ